MQALISKTVSVKLDPETQTRIADLAEALNRSPHWVMREAINQYVDRGEKREAFRQETIDAWDQYKETGLHVTVEEVNTWLSTWGTENELPAPACRK